MSAGGALVTGSARGIGRAIVIALAGAGYDVAVHYRSSGAAAEEVRGEAEALGVRAVTLGGRARIESDGDVRDVRCSRAAAARAVAAAS